MTAFQHLAEHPVSVVTAFTGALGGVIGDPREHDHLAGRVIAKEQTVLLEKFRPEPVLVVVAQGTALTVFRARRVLGDDVECQFCDGRQPFAGILFYIAMRVFLLQSLDLLHQHFHLCEEQRMSKNRPAVNDQGSRLARTHSSSADKSASRSTSTPPAND